MSEPYDFDRLWNYGKPKETAERFLELLPAARTSNDPEYLPQLLTQVARTHGLQGEYDEAHDLLDEAEESIDDTTPVAHVRLLLERGRAINSSGDPEGSIPIFELAWERASEIGNEDYAIDAAHMLGIVEGGSASVVWNERAMAAAEVATSERAKGWLGPLYQNLGWTYHGMDDFERALELFRLGEAFHAERANHPGRRILAWCAGRTVRSMGRFDEALALQRALDEDYRAAGEPVSGFVDEEIGECRLALGHPIDEIREHFRVAAEKLAEIGWVMQSDADRVTRLAEIGAGTRDA